MLRAQGVVLTRKAIGHVSTGLVRVRPGNVSGASDIP